jgi:ubiquinone/menaquinone biosynthesis C-methylase UbiE
MPVISFDRAVDYYDETRGLVPGAVEKIRDAILKYTQVAPSARFLELGIGTGRIALPFIEAGYQYDGVDVSTAMMGRLEQKIAELAAARDKQRTDYHCKLIEADVTQRLPFEDATYDVVILVHVLHLIEDWKAVLREARCVLRPTGSWLLIGGTEKGKDTATESTPTEPMNPNRLVRRQWNDILRDLGVDVQQQTNIRNRDVEFPVFLQELGATVENMDLAEYEQPALSPRMIADRLKARMHSAEWSLPDDIHAEAVHRLEHWLATECPDPDTTIINKGSFRTIVAHW